MLYDISSSINRTENAQMIDFVSSFLDFIDIDNIKNQYDLSKYSENLYVQLRVG